MVTKMSTETASAISHNTYCYINTQNLLIDVHMSDTVLKRRGRQQAISAQMNMTEDTVFGKRLITTVISCEGRTKH